jgi:hypothetical protein
MESLRAVLECEDGGTLMGDEEDRAFRGGPDLVVRLRFLSSRMPMRMSAARIAN